MSDSNSTVIHIQIQVYTTHFNIIYWMFNGLFEYLIGESIRIDENRQNHWMTRNLDCIHLSLCRLRHVSLSNHVQCAVDLRKGRNAEIDIASYRLGRISRLKRYCPGAWLTGRVRVCICLCTNEDPLCNISLGPNTI